MRKFAAILTAVAMTLFSTQAHAQTGQGSMQGSETGSSFSWGIGLGAIAVLAAMSGIVAASSTDKPTTFSH